MNPNSLPAGPAGLIIAHHGMALIPDEGAWFALNYVSPDRLENPALPARYAGTGPRPVGSAIYSLVTRTDFSALHRLRTDETWHFHGGDPAELLLLHPDGRAEVVAFGSDSLGGQHPQVTVPAGTWMGARPARDHAEAYTFFGCTLAPGFDYGDFEPGYRDELQSAYPTQTALIAALTRPAFSHRPSDSLAPATAVAITASGAGRVFHADDVTALALAPGVEVRELIGRFAAGRSQALSCTRFRLAAAASSGASRYLGSDEYFFILSGTGRMTLAAGDTAVGPGSVVVIPRGEPHSLVADASGPLEFLTLLAPAFNPSHYSPETTAITTDAPAARG